MAPKELAPIKISVQSTVKGVQDRIADQIHTVLESWGYKVGMYRDSEIDAAVVVNEGEIALCTYTKLDNHVEPIVQVFNERLSEAYMEGTDVVEFLSRYVPPMGHGSFRAILQRFSYKIYSKGVSDGYVQACADRENGGSA